MGWLHLLVSIICCLTVSCFSTVPVTVSTPPSGSHEILGRKECTYGPSYWCQNFTTSRACLATKHCIQTVWEHQVLPADNSDVCQICKDMVKQARDQLESNETQELLKEVFEGSCKLIPLKEVSKECCKIADNFIPELIEALASQMNPQVVCSVAGLCNSARIQKLLAKQKASGTEQIEYISTAATTTTASPAILDCDSCYVVAQLALNNFQDAEKDEIIERMIEICGRAGSFSDGCAALVITHFQTLYSTMNEEFKPNRFCHVAGVCSEKYHVHEDRIKISATQLMSRPRGDDVACDLCVQLVKHLRDILIANTTQTEFKQVLLGLCGQMKEFKEECKQIVEEYYTIIYNFLLTELDGSTVCSEIGLCKPKPLLDDTNEKLPLWPLLPSEAIEKLEEMKKESPKLHRVKLIGTGLSVHSIRPSTTPPSNMPELMQLPVERLMPQSMIQSKELCQMCELFLHYMQVEITNPASEKEIKDYVKRACENLPQSVRGQCDSFVDVYGDAFIAIVAQKIDPSQVCPAIGVCPGVALPGNKPNCPLCLMAAEFLVDEIKNNKTEETVRQALDAVCLKMPSKLKEDCLEFVTKFSEDLIDMIIADFTPEEICVFAKLCDPPPHAPKLEVSDKSLFKIGDMSSSSTESSEEEGYTGGDVFTNEIPQTPPKGDALNCEICKFVLGEIDRRLNSNATVEEIKTAVETVCIFAPRSSRQKCDKFIDKYADTIIDLLRTTKPSLVCTVMKMCLFGDDTIKTDVMKKSISRCVVCESLMGALIGILEDDQIDGKINEKLEAACSKLPDNMEDVCEGLVEQLAPQIENIITKLPVGPMVCRRLNICAPRKQDVHLIGKEECTWGPSFWCSSTTNAAACGAIKHCQEKVWMADKPQKMKNY